MASRRRKPLFRDRIRTGFVSVTGRTSAAPARRPRANPRPPCSRATIRAPRLAAAEEDSAVDDPRVMLLARLVCLAAVLDIEVGAVRHDPALLALGLATAAVGVAAVLAGPSTP